MRKEWLEAYYKAFRILLLVLAALNGSIAYAIVPKHPILAGANCTMALLIVLGVVFSPRAGGPT